MDIQAITFDVGGTLIAPWPSVGHVYAEVAERAGHRNLSVEQLNRQFTAAWRAKKGFDHSRTAWRRLVEQSFAGLIDPPPDQALFDDLYQRFAQAEVWRVFEEVRPVLDQLQQRQLGLGIISNWDERLRPLLRQLHLDHYFAATVISIEAGFTKPHPQIFRQAAAALGLPASRILHVGDSPAEDLAGASAAGMRALLLDRKARVEFAATIPSLTGLLQLLAEPGATGRLDKD